MSTKKIAEYRKLKKARDDAKLEMSKFFHAYDRGEITKEEYYRRRYPFTKILGTHWYYNKDGSLK